ncbi:FAD-dependent oxidoreductase [Amycolatopsis sp. VC5-11]|uniref:FAD-dependent oxidoreductase n=1 Tax=Amycolatopsis sp. VC5-11 TaxID=3120156 RepID=UPI0030086C3C
MDERRVEVLVAGAGPVGLTVAHELARRGVRVRVVDRAAGPATSSRATANHARTLEAYHQMGVLDEILPRGRKAENFSIHQGGRMLIRFGTDYSRLPTRFPFTLQVDQVIVESVLRDRLAGLGVPVEWSAELCDLEQRPDGVAVGLRHADGTREECTVPWLVGADGAHSTVRQRLGLALRGDSSETWLVADAVVDADLPADSLHWLHADGGPVLLVPFPERGKWRLLDTAPLDRDTSPEAVAARFAERISPALGHRVHVEEPTWLSVFTIQQRKIDRMRAGRCFVAGDAAHVHSPASGQGMNTGVQDAVNLGWKLAQVVRGHAREELLDSYDAERVPVGAALLTSTKKATSLIALRNAAAALLLPAGLGLLGLLKPLKRRVERKLLKGMSGLALEYSASPLTAHDARAGGVRAGHRVAFSAELAANCPGWRELHELSADPRWILLAFAPTSTDRRAALDHVARRYSDTIAVRAVAERTEEADPSAWADPGGALRAGLGVAPGDFVLIRPDGYLACRGALVDTPQLSAVLRRAHLVPSAAVGVR